MERFYEPGAVLQALRPPSENGPVSRSSPALGLAEHGGYAEAALLVNWDVWRFAGRSQLAEVRAFEWEDIKG